MSGKGKAVGLEPKRLAAQRAAELVGDVRVLGLGSGSTTECFIEVIGELRRGGALGELVAVPTSLATERLARRLNIPLSTLEDHPDIDLTVDGADEVDPRLDLMKGRGGALTREKIVACASRSVVIIVDDSKLVEQLGSKMPLPIEVVRFGWKTVEARLPELGGDPVLRMAEGAPYETDQGNYILDCQFAGGIHDPSALATVLSSTPGVVEHGLFLGIADRVVVASEAGVEVMERPPGDGS